ncbi:MAG: Fur family transcriptional regulator [Anaerolineae bacterium]|nr:Fur family transcriptional regulator [Anaerolineae bacterium]MDK1080204.1 Fur family transcriptional regulator [Anaerolineae bacterium]
MTTQSWLSQLKAHGYRLTNARKAVVEIVATTTSALNPLQVYEAAKSTYQGLGLVSVYRTLEKLEELELIQRVHLPDGCNAYLPQADGHQHLLICEGCGKAEYFEGDNMEALFSKVAGKHGFSIHEHWLQLFGVCSQCELAASG